MPSLGQPENTGADTLVTIPLLCTGFRRGRNSPKGIRFCDFSFRGSRIIQVATMLGPGNLPRTFRAAAERFADQLRANFASLIPAQPEDQLKSPVRELLAAVTGNVLTRTETQLYEVGGRPDIGVSVRDALC